MNELENEINEYKKQLKEKEKLALEKAEEILGDSFEIEKSIGFLEWKKNSIPIEPIKFKTKSQKPKKIK